MRRVTPSANPALTGDHAADEFLGAVYFRRVQRHPKRHFGRSQKEVRMSNTHDEQIARWNQQRGPRVGDWCETKDGGLHRIGGVRGGRIRLASPSGRFSLGSEGVTYFGIFIAHPAIPTSSLLKQPERKPGAIHQPHFTVDCRVFKER